MKFLYNAFGYKLDLEICVFDLRLVKLVDYFASLLITSRIQNYK